MVRTYASFFAFALAIIFCIPISASAATIYMNSSTGNDTTGDGSSGNPYATFHKGYTIANVNDTLSLTGTFDWSSAGETGDAVTSGYTIAKNIVITGQSATSTFIQAAPTSGTAGKRVFTFSSNASTTIQNLTIRYGYLGGSGGCLSLGGGTTLLLSAVDMSDCKTTTSASYGGGAIQSYNATTTITNSSFHGNYAGGSGGALYISGSLGVLTITNSTMSDNIAASGSGGGGGMWFQDGTAHLTNTTIARNTGGYGGGIDLYYSGTINLENSIVAGNTGSGAMNIYRQSGSYTSRGHNIVGASTANMTQAAGDWMWASGVSADTGNFQLYSVGTTGLLNLDSTSGINDALNGIYNVALLASSIAINNGTDTAVGSVPIPATDVRGATRSGVTDIGAFEYGGTGLSIVAPTTQTSGVSFSSVGYDRMTVSWTSGNGSRHAVFIKAASSGTASPVDGTRYTGSSVFGSGTQIGSSGWYVIYDGINGTTITVTGLSASTSYIIQGFDYNGVSAGQEKYLTSTASSNPGVQASYTPVTLYVNSSTGNDTTGDGSSGTPYKTFNKGYTVSNRADTLDLTGTFDWSSADETGDAVTTGYSLAKDITITGHNADATIIQAVSTDNTATARVFTVVSPAIVTMQNLSLRYGKTASGACVLTNTGTTLTLSHVEIYSCRASGSGGGVYTQATTTINNSAIYNNVGGSSGGGVMASGSTARLFVTNSTIYGNSQTSVSGGGAGLQVDSSAQGTITSSTIVGNTGYYGGGVSVYTSTVLYVKNSIIAANTGNSVSYRDVFVLSGTLTSNGYNIVGNGMTATTGDWTDTNNDSTYNLFSVGTTGSLNLDSTANLNANPYQTHTWASLVNSIAIDRGSNASANNGVAIPSTDQRTGARSGTMDIGAYEYGSVTDITAPSVSLTAPTASATVSGASVALSATASDNVAVAGVKFYVDGVLQGVEDTTSTYGITWDSTATSTGSHSAFAVARDTSNNYATSTSVSFSVDNTSSVISAITASPTATTVTITWTTDEASSSRINFGLTSNYGTSTAETDTSPRVTSHSVLLALLSACTQYHYQVQSIDAVSNTATSSDATFLTTGCTGSASVSATGVGTITTASGGTLTQGTLTLTVPVSFTSTSSSAVFQANQLDGVTFFETAGVPSGKTRVGNVVFNLKALTDVTTSLATFSTGLTVTLAYQTGDVAGLDESSLVIYRYDGSTWSALTSCSVDTSAKTVTCTTTAFSDFAIFGSTASTPVSTTTTTTARGNGLIFVGTAADLPGYVAPRPQVIHPDGRIVYLDAEIPITTSIAVTPISSTTPERVASTTRFTHTLRPRQTDIEVRALQQFLNTHGFPTASSGFGSLGNESNYFGTRTQLALKKFQEAHAKDILAPLGLSKGTGIFGEATRGFVNTLFVQ